jgi:hypothetical protein
VPGDRLAQAQMPGRIGVNADVLGVGVQLAGQQPPPGLVREQPGVWDAGAAQRRTR